MKHGRTLTVLHIFSGDLWAGAEVMIFNLLNKLKEYPDLKIIALSLNNGTLSSKLQETGIEVHIIPEISNSFLKILAKSLILFKSRNIDIIHSHRYKENIIAMLLKIFLRVKILLTTIHGLPEVTVNGNKPLLDFRTTINYFIIRTFFSKVIAVSKEMREVLTRKYNFNEGKVFVIYNGIDTNSQNEANGAGRKTSSSETLRIGTVGRMVPVKDFNLFIEIAAQIRAQKTNVLFSILGDGPLKEQLIKRAKELDLNNCIEFLLPRTDPFPFYQTLDIYLNTSFHEGIPMSILEAMLSGKPVIAPNVGGIPEIISNNNEGFVTEGRKPKAFADVCLKLLNDKELRTSIGKNASKRVSMIFSSPSMAKAYLKLYNYA